MTTRDVAAAFREASVKTAADLRTIATQMQLLELSRLSLPEIERLTDEVARVVPAGNVPGMILSGLARLGGREVDPDESRKHIGLLFKGVRQVLDHAVYHTFFAGPAAILYAYQRLLALSGKDVDAAFPDGTWQFYLEFALREDSARHTNETTGFDERLRQHNIRLAEADRLSAWVLAVTYFLRQLPDILANEWRERIFLRLLADVAEEFSLPDASAHRTLYTTWERQRPYQRGADAGQDDYPTYRRRLFDTFVEPYFTALPAAARDALTARSQDAESTSLPAFQRQMTWLAYLEPGVYNESRQHYTLDEALLGIIYQGRYFLLPLSDLLDPKLARAQAAAILAHQPDLPTATLDDALVFARRPDHAALRRQLDKQSLRELDQLRHTPVLLNWDERDASHPLDFIRQGKRGIGDHALTVFRTRDSVVFDQSHIFFDGAWGAAVAEIMTNEALSWARYLAQTAPPRPARDVPYSPALQASDNFLEQAGKVASRAETSAENIAVRLGPIQALRKLLKQRSDLAQVTVNDLFILYRGLHAQRYQPSPRLQDALTTLAAERDSAAQDAYRLVQESLERLEGKNPAILIPIDASQHDPRERLFPTTFRNPLTDFLAQHEHTLEALRAYRDASPRQRTKVFQTFYDAQLTYLRLIGGFGELLARYKHIAVSGQSTSTASIKFLGHLPGALQKLLDAIPGKFDVLNEVIKGEEVFSNMGRVARGSSLRRFITAKDDNEQKTLAWGVLTDDHDVVHLSLRDFRPHVDALYRLGRADLAQWLAQDYLDAYADGLNAYVRELREITIASRETVLGDKGES